MAFKPRTVRRLILLGAIGGVFVLGSVGYFVVRPLQREHKLEQMRVDGLEAAKAGDHAVAVALLGRYLRVTPGADPEYRLAHARSRLAFQVRDGGHIRVAIQSYRDYLKAVPSDTEAALELLPLFNLTGQHYVEAKTLAESLIEQHQESGLVVFRELIFAKKELEGDSDSLGLLYAQAAEHPDAEFRDLAGYIGWLITHERMEEAQAILDLRLVEYNGAMVDRFLSVWITEAMVYRDGPSDQQVAALSSVLRINPETGAWDQEPDALDPILVNFCAKLFNAYGRVDLSLLLRETSVALNGADDEFSISVIARRGYWNREYEALLAMEFESDEDEPLPDLTAYQALSLRDQDQDALAQEKIDALAGIKYDFRGQIWVELIKAKDLLDLEDSTDEQLEEAYLLAKKANEDYHEPTLALVMGDIEYRRGDLETARARWDLSHQIVVEQTDSWEWTTPYERIIYAYTREARLGEVVEYLEELRIFAMGVKPSYANIMLVYRSYAELARLGQASEDVLRVLVEQYEKVYTHLTPEERAFFSPSIATIYASIGKRDRAREILVEAAGATSDQHTLNEMFKADQFYKLGFAELAGIDVSEVMKSSPETALSYALTEFGNLEHIEEGIAIFDQGRLASDEETRYRWELERVRYIDTISEPTNASADGQAEKSFAHHAWDELLTEYPDKVDLLYLFAESKALSRNLNEVDRVIEKVMDKTGISGSDVPSRLELARAVAMVAQGDVTKTIRDEAIGIVNRVLARDQGNINARNMLGRLYELRSSPSVTDENERFASEYDLAVEEYMTIARELKGRKALEYYFSAVRFSIEMGKHSSAREYLLEVTNKFSGDLGVHFEAAKQFEQIGDLQRAQAMYAAVYDQASNRMVKIDSGLALAKMLITSSERSQAQKILSEIASEEILAESQVYQLASLYAKNGYSEEGGLVVGNGEQYGLDKATAMMIHAQYTGAYDRESYESVLREMVEEDQTNENAWAMLTKHLFNTDRGDEAQDVLARAIELNPQSNQLKLISMVSDGQVQTFAELLKSGAIESGDLMEQIAPRADAYMQARESGSTQELQFMLVTMIQDFPSLKPLQQYLTRELASLPGVHPAVIVENIGPIARRFPSDSLIMGVACNAYLRIGQPAQAVELANVWRSNMAGSPMSADLVIAQGQIQLERFRQASRTLQPYLLHVDQNSTDPLAAEVLYTYCQAQLLDGENPNSIANRLEGLLSEPESFGRTIWINLAGNSVPSADVAAEWMKQVTPHLLESERMLAAQKWLEIIERFDMYNPDFARAAIDLIGEADQVNTENLVQSNLLIQAYGVLAKCLEDSEQRNEAYRRSISLLDQLHTIEPQNPIHLAKAASYAQASGDWELAQAKYRQILGMNIQSVAFVASIENNLAVLIEQNSDVQSELEEALELAQSASEIAKIGVFFGSRGWVELKLDMLAEAERSFERCVEYEPNSLEGWVGLAITRYQGGESREEDALNAFRQAQSLMRTQELSASLADKLHSFGNPNWVLTDASESP